MDNYELTYTYGIIRFSVYAIIRYLVPKTLIGKIGKTNFYVKMIVISIFYTLQGYIVYKINKYFKNKYIN